MDHKPAGQLAAQLAPELQTSHWINTPKPITLASLRGKVVLVEAFQMLCPGCVSHGLPQAQRAAQLFGNSGLVVLGLHTVFEHHAAQGSLEALKAFAHEYRLTFPIAIDQPSASGDAPKTMLAYAMRGTPSLILIDREGRIRKQNFGQEEDMAVGAEIMALLGEPARALNRDNSTASTDDNCDENGCPIPEAK